MKKLYTFLLILFLCSSCAKPYQASLYREVGLSGDSFEIVNSMGVALYRKKELSDEARIKIKIALDELNKYRAISIYSIDEYERYNRLLGAGGCEYSLNKLREKSARLKIVIQKYLGTGRN